MQQVKKFVELTKMKRELEAQLKEVNEEMAVYDKEVQEFFIDAGIQSMNVDGFTVYIARELSAKKRADVDYVALLRNSEFAWLVKEDVNMISVKSAIREAAETGSAVTEKITVPEILEQCFEIGDYFKARIRRS